MIEKVDFLLFFSFFYLFLLNYFFWQKARPKPYDESKVNIIGSSNYEMPGIPSLAQENTLVNVTITILSYVILYTIVNHL